MKLCYYECLKIIQRKIFWYILLCFLFFDFVFVLGWKYIQDPSGYIRFYEEEIEEILADKTLENGYTWLANEQQLYEEIQSYEQATILEEDSISLSEEASIYLANNENNTYFWDERAQVIEEYYTYYDTILHYDTYIDGIYTKYTQLQNSPRWVTMSNTQQEDLQQQIQLYDSLKNSQLEAISYKSAQTYVDLSIGNYFALCYVLLCVILLFQEDTSHMHELLVSTRNGDKKTLRAKALSLCILCVIGVSSFLILDACIYRIIFGAFPLFTKIQAIPIFYESPYAYSFLQWFIYHILFSTFSSSCIGYFFLCCFCVWKRRYLGLLCFCMFIIIEALCFLLIPKNSAWYALSLYNIFEVLQNDSIGMINSSLSIMHIRIPYFFCMGIGLGCLASICILFFLTLGNRSQHNRCKRFSFPITIASLSLFIQEGFRFIWIRKGGVYLSILFVGVLSVFGYRMMNDQQVRNQAEEIAKIYEPYEGVVSTQVYQALTDKINEINVQEKIVENAKQAYKEQSITREEYISIQQVYEKQKTQYDIYKELYEQIQDGASYIVYPNGFLALFGLNEIHRNAISTLIIICFLVLWVSRSYVSVEEEILYKSTKNGRKKRKHRVIGISICIGIMIVFVIEVFDYLHIASLYPMQNWDVPMQTLFELAQSDDVYQWGSWSIFSYFILSIGVKLFGTISMMLITTTIFRYCKGQFQGILLCLCLFLLPMFLYYYQIDFVSWLSLFDLLMGHLFLLKTYTLGKLIGILMIDGIAYVAYSRSFKSR